ncbi:MAG: GAF domain-containing protein [Caldilineaceae bacterium]
MWPSPEPTNSVPKPSQIAPPTNKLGYLSSALGVLGLDGTIRSVNRAMLDLLEFRSSEVIGRHFSQFLYTLEPPLIEGGFPALLELGSADISVPLRCGRDRFVQIEMRLVVIYDEQAQPFGVLATSSEGDEQAFLVRRAMAKVAEQVSQIIAYRPSSGSLWSRIFALCEQLFETPSGWLLLRDDSGQTHTPFTFGPLHGQLDGLCNGVAIQDCPCHILVDSQGEVCAVNSMDCPWLSPTPNSTNPHSNPRHHAIAPILGETGARIGEICLVAPLGRIFHRHELLLMDAITDQIGQAMDRGEIHFLPRSNGRDWLPLRNEDASFELIDIFEQILENLATIVPFASAGVFLQVPAGLRLMASVNHPQARDMRGELFPVAENQLSHEIMRTRRLLIIDDVRKDSRFRLWGGLDYIRGWMGLPLVINDTVIGLITVDSEQVAGFDLQDGKVAQAFADQAAVAVEKSRLAVELDQEKRSLELLYQLGQRLVATLEPKEVAAKALVLITQAFNDCYGEIYVYERGQAFLQLLAAQNHRPDVVAKLPGQPYLRVGAGIVGIVTEMRRPILIANVDEDPRWIPIPDMELTIRSVAAIPLIARNEVVGVLVLGSAQLNAFTHAYLAVFQSIALPVALALQNARLFAAERQGRQEAEMLRNATGTLTLDLRLEQILRILLERLRQVVHFDSACVLLMEGHNLLALAELGLPHPEEVMAQRFPVSSSLFMMIQRERRAIFFADVQKISHFSGWGGTSNTRGWMGVPLIHRGDVLGYITMDSLTENAFGEQEASLAQAFANQMAVTLVNGKLLQDSQQLAAEQQVMSGILRGLNGAGSLQEIQTAVAGGLHKLIGPAAVEIALYQPDEQRVIAERTCWTEASDEPTTSSHSYKFGESSAIDLHLQGKSHFSQALIDESIWPVEAAWQKQNYHSRISLPLRGDDRILGHVQLLWRDRMEPNWAIHFSLPQIVESVALVAQKLGLLEQATHRADQLQLLIHLSSSLRAAEGRSQIIQTASATAISVFKADQAYVVMPVAGKEELRVVAQAGTGPEVPYSVSLYGNTIAGRVFRSGTPFFSPNLFAEPNVAPQALQTWKESGVDFASALFAPLRAGDEIEGVIAIVNTADRRSFYPADLRLLNAMAETIGGALHRASILEGLEQRVLERTADLAQANKRLMELDQLKSDFVANVSHELRTPLTNIKLYLELLRNGRSERRLEYLGVVDRETEHLHALIESILALTELDEPVSIAMPTFSTVNLGDLMRSLFARFQEQARTAGLQFSFLSDPQTVTVLGNPEQILQLAANLVSNALNYTKPGGRVDLSVEISAEGEPGIVVRDTGIGIQPDELSAIFDRFYRSNRVIEAQLPGTGLGLSIVNGVVLSHGGRIVVESEPDVGTTFFVWFPPVSEGGAD